MLLQRQGRLSTGCSLLRRRAQLLAAGCVVAATASVFGVAELPAQEPGRHETGQHEPGHEERRLRAERDRLLAAVRALEAEVSALRARLEPAEPAPPRATGAPLVFEVAEEAVAAEPVPPDATEPELQGRVPIVGEVPVLGDLFTGERVGAAPPEQAAEAAAADSRYVVDLVTRAIDLRGELEIAKHRRALLAERFEKGVSTSEEHRIAEIQLETIQRKYQVVGQMVEAEQEATALELESLVESAKALPKGAPRDHVESRVVRLEARLRLLVSAR